MTGTGRPWDWSAAGWQNPESVAKLSAAASTSRPIGREAKMPVSRASASEEVARMKKHLRNVAK